MIYVTATFSPDGGRPYTFTFNGSADALSEGQKMIGDTKNGPSEVWIKGINVPKPSFKCSAVSLLENDDAPAIGHNNPPEDVDTADYGASAPDAVLEPYADTMAEADNWLDGEPLSDQAQIDAVDVLRDELRAAKRVLTKARDAAVKPLHDAWKSEVEVWKGPAKKIDMRISGLADLGADLRKRIDAEQSAARRAAWEEKRRAEEAAREAAEEAEKRAGDIAAMEAANEARIAAKEAEKAAQEASRDKVKGLRTVERHQIENVMSVVSHIMLTDPDSVTAFAETYVAKSKDKANIPGVKVWKEKVAW